MKNRVIWLLLACGFGISISCNSVSDQEMKEEVRAICVPFDSLHVIVWHTVYDGAYLGNYSACGESEVRSFTASFDAGFLQKQLGGSLDHKPIDIYVFDKTDKENCYLAEIVRLMRKRHLVYIKKGQTGLKFVRGDLFHPATEHIVLSDNKNQ